MSREKTCCFTGHRIIKNCDREVIVERLEFIIESLIENGVTDFCAGGALGFDTVAAEAVLRIRRRNPKVRLILMLPCKDQADKWSAENIRKYEDIKASADEVNFTSQIYTRGCMHARNRALVDRSSYCICYMYKNSGGTYYTVNYARNNNIAILRV